VLTQPVVAPAIAGSAFCVGSTLKLKAMVKIKSARLNHRASIEDLCLKHLLCERVTKNL